MGEQHDQTSNRRVSTSTMSPLSALYEAHASQVRRNLSSFGVGPSDLDDLSQEVFLVVMAKCEALRQVARVDLWLREICRKVAASHRRRGGRQRELPTSDALASLVDAGPAQSAALELREDAERLHHAIAALDDEARDLIAMHELGGLPLVEVAALVERDRKTVKKRIIEANRKLIGLFRAQARPQHAERNPPPARVSVPMVANSDAALSVPLRVLGQSADITIGLVGPVLIAVWPGPPTLEALELLDRELCRAADQLGSGLVYLAIVEASTSTPSLAARQKITHMLRRHAGHYGVCAHVLLGGFSWIARPIMAGLALLAGFPSSMPFFGSTERAADWLVSGFLRGGLLDVPTLSASIEEIRACARAGRTSEPTAARASQRPRRG